MQLASGEKDTPFEQRRVFKNAQLQARWQEGLAADPDYEKIRQAIAQRDTSRFPASLGLQAVAQMAEASLNEKGVPLYRGAVWIPNYEPLRTAIIQESHDSTATGHPGRDGTIEVLRRQFYWPRIGSDMKRFVRNCDVCGRSKIWRQKKHGLLRPLPIPERPWAGISIDFMTHLPSSKECTNLMVITCRMTGNLILAPLRELTTETVANEFLWVFYRHHGPPQWIVSDRGTQWVNGFWERVCELIRIERKLSTAYHPQTDGATERVNQEVQAYLRAYCYSW